MAYNYLSGEPITGVESGRPLVVRSPDSRLELATFMRTLLLSALATLRIGLDVLQRDERVGIDRMFAHGGLFRTKGVAQALLAAALDTPITAGELAGEGGAWGMAILASYAATQPVGRPLERFLDEQVFAEGSQETIAPAPTDVAGFNRFLERYVQLLPVERAAAVI
jgi:sugar (pentulose or hexulose) kinase